MKLNRKALSFAITLVFLYGFILFSISAEALACSRILSADNGQAVLVGRNMDWPVDMGTALLVFSRGIKRDGLAGGNSLSWTSKYGSIAVASYASGNKGAVSDGMNEKGLAANLLWLDKSDYGERDERIPGLSISLWAQYFLDNYATVEEAVDAISKAPYQLITMAIPEGEITETAYIHLSLEDKTGDSAIIEYTNGKPVIYHDRSYAVMTNEPPLKEQLENLRQYEGFGGNKPLPGTTKPQDRFVRASYYLKYLPKPKNLREALAGVFSITRNVSQPFRVSVDPKHPNISSTLWSTVADLTNGTYYFESTSSPYLIWVNIHEFDLNDGASVMKLDLTNNPDFAGDVTQHFMQTKSFEFMSSVQSEKTK